MTKQTETKAKVEETKEQQVDPMEVIKQLQQQIAVMQVALLAKEEPKEKAKPVIIVENGTRKFKGLVR